MNQHLLLSLVDITIGYIYSVGLGSLLTYYFADFTGKAIKEFAEGKEYYRWTASLVGATERILYTSAILFNRLEFIAIWLVFKSASQWRRWGNKETTNQTEINPYQERAIFNSYLINSGLSIAYGVLGGQIALWLKHNHVYIAIFSGVGLVLINIFLLELLMPNTRKAKAIKRRKKSK